MTIPRSRDLRLLAGAAGLSALGDFMAVFPLILHVQQRTGSAFAVSALIFALWGPVVLAAGLAGAIVDRFENRALLVVVSFAQAAVVAGDGRRRRRAVGAAAADGAARVRRRGQPAGGVRARARGGRARTSTRARANGLMETVRSLGFTAGPLVGGALGAAGLLRLALALERAVVRGRRRRRARCCGRAAARPRAGADDAGARPRRLRLPRPRARRSRSRSAARSPRSRVFSISVTAEPFFVTDVLGAGALAYGVLLTAWTLGMAAGSAGLAHRVPRAALAAGGARRGRRSRAPASPARRSSPVLWMALIGFSFGGVAHGVKNVLLRTLIHERVPEALRGRAFAAYNGARNGAELGALALGGLVVGAFGARPALLVAGLGPAADRRGLPALLLTRRRAAAALTTAEGRALHAHVQG